MNCNHSIVRIANIVTKFTIVPSKYLQHGHRMLQCPSITTIVFKDPDWKLSHSVNINSIQTQLTLGFMDGDCITTWLLYFCPCLSIHINNNNLGELESMHKTIKKHTSHICGYYNTVATFRFFKDPSCTLRCVDAHTYGFTIPHLPIFKHMEVWGDCQIKPQVSLATRTEVIL